MNNCSFKEASQGPNNSHVSSTMGFGVEKFPAALKQAL